MKEGPTKKTRKHDPVYRRIFNRAQIMEEILRRFATGPWSAHLDFSTWRSSWTSVKRRFPESGLLRRSE